MNNQRVSLHASLLCCLSLCWVAPSATANDALSTRAAAGASIPGSETPLPKWLWGVWTRDWILVGQSKSSPLDVHYLQTPTFFADIRIPKERSGFSTAKSFADLTDQQLRQLASQNGLTGLTTLVGNIATWSDEIAFQPYTGTPDTSRLERKPPNMMLEVGLDGSFTESWSRVPDGSRQFLVVRVKHFGRLLHSLVVVGDRFIYVRNRARELPRASSLDALIEATKASREQVVEYLDCEFSLGLIRGGSVPWEIHQSTLPWREGHHLDFVDELTVGGGGTTLAPKAAGNDEWSIPVNTLNPKQIKALFNANAVSK